MDESNSSFKQNPLAAFATAIVLGLFALIITLQSPITPWGYSDPGVDSSVFRYVALEMHNGGVPYLDTFDHKGPLLYLINWAGMLIGYYRGLWFIEFIAILCTVVAVYRIFRMFCSRFASCIGVLLVLTPLFSYFEGGNLTEEYALPFIAWSAYSYLCVAHDNGSRSAVSSIMRGVCLGAILMLRPNMIAIWIAFGLLCVYFDVRQRNYKRLVSSFVWLFAGSGLLIAPIVGWLIVNGAFTDFINDYIVFNFAYSGSTSFALAIAARMHSLMDYVDSIYFTSALAILGYVIFRNRSPVAVASCAFLVLSVFSICISGRSYPHYAMVLIPCYAYPYALLLKSAVRGHSNSPELLLERFVSIAACLLLVFSYALHMWFLSSSLAIDNVTQGSNRSPALTEVSEYIEGNSKPDERISVYGNWDAVYLESHRLSATEYSYQQPIGDTDERILDAYYAQLDAATPAFIVAKDTSIDARLKEFLRNHNYKEEYRVSGEGFIAFIYGRDARTSGVNE